MIRTPRPPPDTRPRWCPTSRPTSRIAGGTIGTTTPGSKGRSPWRRKQRPRSTARTTAERIRDLDRVEVNVPVLGQIRIPRPERLAFYGGLAALAALQLIDWPIAAALAVGHILSEDHHSRVAQELGAALEEV